MIECPQAVLSALESKEKYRTFLRQVAAQRPFRRVTAEIRDSPFLLAISAAGEDSKDETKYELARASDIYIMDNSFFGRMFPVKRAPHESDLEEFYSLIGSKYISKEVNKKYDVVGVAQKNTSLTQALLERIHERSPLLVSPSITSRPLVANAAKVLEETNLEVFEASELKAIYSLGKSVRNQRTTCCAQPGNFNKTSLYVTADFDWFDVGYAIGELILERCQLEDAFFISSLLEAPLEQLRARGFPVDRIFKLDEPLPEPDPVVPSTSITRVDGPNANAPTTSNPMPPPPTSALPAVPPVPGADSQKNEPSTEHGKGNKGSNSDRTKSTSSDSNENTAVPTMSSDGYAAILKQMYPSADEHYIRNRLGDNPSLDQMRSLAEEMATAGYPKDDPKDGTSKTSVGANKEVN
jgi:hypothetical protein